MQEISCSVIYWLQLEQFLLKVPIHALFTMVLEALNALSESRTGIDGISHNGSSDSLIHLAHIIGDSQHSNSPWAILIPAW